MRRASTCPDVQDLQRFLLGQNTAEEAEAFEDHLEQCERCLSTLHTLQAEDSVVEALRSPSGAGAEAGSETVRRLAEQLKTLRPASAAGTRALSQAAPLPDAGTEATYPFLAPGLDPSALGRLGHYQVRRVLGAGGMGVVFLAYDPNLERLVALKAMLPELAANPSARQRFLREAKAAAAIRHDHIVTIYQVGEDRGAPFLAMEFLEGEALDQRLKREGQLPVKDVLRIGRETAQALAAAHECGLIHRDIKPANIWLEQREEGGRRQEQAPSQAATSSTAVERPSSYRVKILDFGLARSDADSAHLTQSGAILGTPAFMAPEQAHGKPVDARGDLFSLGCVLYRMATGQLPFEGTDTISTLLAVSTAQPRPPRELNPALPPALGELVMRLLAKDPDDRPPSARAVVEAVEAIVQGPGPATSGRRWGRRTRFCVAAVVFLALLGGGSLLFGPTILRFVRNEGVLVIEIDDPKVQAVIDQAGLTIRDRTRDRIYQIKPGPQPLKTGEYVLEVTEVGGDLRLFTKEFTITRGGQTAVRVTLDRKAAADKAVAWAGQGTKHLFADPAHALKGVPDFRDLAGASPKEFSAWRAALGPDFRLALVTSRQGRGTPLFNAVAVREKEPLLVRFFPGVTDGEAPQNFKRLTEDGFRLLSVCCNAGTDPKVNWTEAQVWVKDGLGFHAQPGSLPDLMAFIDRKKAENMRPYWLDRVSARDGPSYCGLELKDEHRRWEAFYTLSPEELLSTVAFYQRKGWRPDVVSAHWDGGRLRFMLVVVDNADGIDWRFRMDMRLAEYRKESAGQKRQGLFPLAVTSYGDKADVRYAAVWVRYRLPGAAPVPVSPAPTIPADRALAWAEAQPKHCFSDPAHALYEVSDFRELAGATSKELRDWQGALGKDFNVSFLSSRKGSGKPLFNAVAVRDRKPHEFRCHLDFTPEEGAAAWDRLTPAGFRPLVDCAVPSADPKVPYVASHVWVKDGVGFYLWFGSLEHLIGEIAKAKPGGSRLACLHQRPSHDDPSYVCIVPDDQGRPWDAFYHLDCDELLATVAFYRRKGWRPDVVASHWDGGRLRFMLVVVVDNSDSVDWRFRMDMDLAAYRKESAGQKRSGLMPLAVASYGNDADVRYAAVWVRYRIPDGTK